VLSGCSTPPGSITHYPAAHTLRLTRADYQDRVNAIWTSQIAAVLMGFQFEHKVASTFWVDRYRSDTTARQWMMIGTTRCAPFGLLKNTGSA